LRTARQSNRCYAIAKNALMVTADRRACALLWRRRHMTDNGFVTLRASLVF
jgi:hypothetical protein